MTNDASEGELGKVIESFVDQIPDHVNDLPYIPDRTRTEAEWKHIAIAMAKYINDMNNLSRDEVERLVEMVSNDTELFKKLIKDRGGNYMTEMMTELEKQHAFIQDIKKRLGM